MNPISDTAFYCCGIRMDDAKRDPSVCNDIYAERFMDERGRGIYEPFRSEKMANISNITRCRIIDDYLSVELKNTPGSNVITIGAGFDTRPYRLAGGNWIELDEPQIITYKNERLPIKECKNPLQRISVEFNHERLAGKFEDIDKKARTLIVIEGVFMYLENEAIEQTLKEIQQAFPHHELYCDLMTRRFFDQFAQSIHAKLVATGARFSNLGEDPAEIFVSHDYQQVERVTIFRRSGELGTLWDQARVPRFVSWLLLNLFKKGLNGYAVYHFRYER